MLSSVVSCDNIMIMRSFVVVDKMLVLHIFTIHES